MQSKAAGSSQDAFGVEVGAAVAEEAPLGAVGCDLGEIEARGQHALLRLAEALDELAGVIGDEGMAVEFLRRAVILLDADAVGGHDWHGIRNRVVLYSAP